MDDITKKVLASFGLIIAIVSSFVIQPLEDFRNYIISHIIAGVLHLFGIDIDPNSFFNLLSSIGNLAIAMIPLIIVGIPVAILIFVLKR